MTDTADRPPGDRPARADQRVPGRASHRRRPAPRRGRRWVPTVTAVLVGLVAGAGTALAASANARTDAFLDSAVAGVLGGPTTTAAASADSAPDESPVDRLLDGGGAASRTSGVRPFGVPDPIVVSKDVVGPVDPVPSVTAVPPGLTAADVSAGLMSADVPESAGGTLVVVPGSVPAPGAGAVRTVRVEVEEGLAVDGAAFAATVMATLNDPRSWGAGGTMTFARTDGDAELRVVLASPETVDDLCAPLRTEGEVSCGRAGHAVLNLRRWVEATPEYAADKTAYRQYLVNHEVGHLLGHPHERCPGAGQPAPVMQQQSYQAAPCVPNAWPFP